MSPIKENLLSITELAKLRQVTSETLRYYDRIGLITPDYVDPQTRYRYYSIRQYEKLGTIKELRQLGMSIHDITDVIVVTADGAQHPLGLGGYLDIGILDTMKDLFVNFIGAVVFSFIGYFYVKNRGKGWFAKRFIPKVLPESGAKK